MRLIVGLGNPGLKYKHTRHNAGFLAVDFLAKKFDKKAKWKKNKTRICLYTWTEKKGEEYKFIKPLTFMNNSGKAIKYAVKKHNLENDQIYIIYDELDLPFGSVRFRTSGSSAGHNGIKSIIQELDTDQFNRIRIGIQTEDIEKIPAEKFVLSRFSQEERKILKDKVFAEVEKLVFEN